MEKNPEISVIIPMYNREKYIAQSVGSVLAQTFRDIEVVVVDDGSTDSSFSICEGIRVAGGDDRIRILRHPVNRGEAETMLTGLSAARGKYVHIVHSDDFLLPDALMTFHSVAEKYGADAVHTVVRVQPTEEGGSVIRPGAKYVVLRHDWGSQRDIQEPTLVPFDPWRRLNEEYIDGGTFTDWQYKFFRRDFLMGINITGMFAALEWLMKARTYVKIPNPTYIWRTNPTSITNNRRTAKDLPEAFGLIMKIQDEMEAVVRRIDYLKDKPGICELLKFRTANGYFVWNVDRFETYKDGISRDIYDVVSKSAHKYTGGGLHGHYHSCSTSPVRGGSSMSRWITSGNSHESPYERAKAA